MNILDYAQIYDETRIFSHPEDISRIIKVCFNRGVTITPELAEELWDNYSDECFAIWLFLPDSDKELFDILIEQAVKYNHRRGII